MQRCHWHLQSPTITLLAGALLAATTASASNWIMLQGTEMPNAPSYKPFGFVGIDYQQTGGADLVAGPWNGQPLVLNQIGPKLENSSELQLSYARVGLRGRLLDGKLNYWISPLAGYNGISQNGSPNLKFTDVSATLNLIPHARIRVGQFKQPGSEEGLQPAVLRDYVNPTSVGMQIVNERFFDSDGTPKDTDNVYDGPLSGWRDTGVQIFDAFETLTLGLTYRHNKHFRVLADYQFRDVDAPGLPSSAPPNHILSKVDDRFGIRLWAKF